jgi:hypothetical protein
MNDEERQRTMDFILKQQAQFSAGMQKLEEADARAEKRLDQLGRTVVLLARQFRRERKDLRERIAALVDAQIRTEEITRENSEAIRALTAATERNSEAIRALTDTTGRNSEDISTLARTMDEIARRMAGDGDKS